MSIEFNLAEKKIINYPYEKIKEHIHLDLHELASGSKFIESFTEIKSNHFEIQTQEIKKMGKTISLKTSVELLVNAEKGLVQLRTFENNDSDNLSFDCKMRFIPDDKHTLIALKFDGDVNLGFPKLVEKGIKKFADKEIEKLLLKLLEKFEHNK